MNRQRLLGLLAGSLITAAAAVPAFAEGPSENASEKARGAQAGALEAHDAHGEKANRGVASLKKRRAVQGELTKVEGDAPALTLTLETKHAEQFLVVTNGDTELRGKGHDDLTLAGLKDGKLIGARIIAQGERDGDKLVANHLIVRPAKSERSEEEREERRAAKGRTVTTGVASNVSIAANGAGSLTVTPQGGSAVTILVDADTQYQLKGVAGLANGQTVRVVSVKNDAEQNVAKRIRVPAGD